MYLKEVIMIDVESESEFTVLVADLIVKLADLKEFKLLVWISGSEIAYEFDSYCDFYFMQEGFRVSYENVIDYIYYDMISGIKVVS